MAEVEDFSPPRQWVDSSPELQGTCSSFQGPCSVEKHVSHEDSRRGDAAWSHTNLFTRSAEQDHVAHIITCHHCTAACRNINTAVPATRGKDKISAASHRQVTAAALWFTSRPWQGRLQQIVTAISCLMVWAWVSGRGMAYQQCFLLVTEYEITF